MNRSRSSSRLRRRSDSTQRFNVEKLEDRLLLHGGGHHHAHGFASNRFDRVHHLHGDPVSDFIRNEEGAPPGGDGSTSDGTTLSAGPTLVPALNSLPGALASLYLDFDGHFEAQWGSYSNITTPAFDQDGDVTTFSDGELAAIQAIWRYVAEDYAPFKINVTTVEPTSFANGVALRVAIGGNGSWTGATYGGVSYVNSFTSSIVNTVFVFPKNLSNGKPKYTGDASSHESGHGFGLQHQSLWSGGSLVQRYYTGPGDGRAPLMGNSYSATRGLWWYGTSSISSTSIQDDMAVISRTQNGFGYRADDYGNTAATATPLTVSSNQVTGSGVITATSDVDYFSFTTDAGQISLSVLVPASVNNLDSVLQLRNSAGTLIASADPTTSFAATITATVTGGSYRLVVASHGSYGDVGQYTVTGTIIPPTNVVNAPTNLAAATVSNEADLTWSDNAVNETGYSVERSADGANWSEVARLAADSAKYIDAALSLGSTYHYRVRAFNSSTGSDYSNQATAVVAPTAPAGLSALPVSSSRIDLAWTDVAGETGYKIDRSLDGVAWTQIALTGAGTTSFQDLGLSAGTTHYYRVRATNSGGDSPFSNLASATTLASQLPPSAPSNLSATPSSATRVDLSWLDSSQTEDGFYIERSSNGGKSWTQIAQVGSNSTKFIDGSVIKRKTYYYRVRAYNSGGNSAYSNLAKVTTPAK